MFCIILPVAKVPWLFLEVQYMTCEMWHVTCHMSHVTCCGGWTFSQYFSCLALMVCDLWYFEDLEEKDEWLSQWMNGWISDKDVFRRAPATPGLLNKFISNQKCIFCLNVLAISKEIWKIGGGLEVWHYHGECLSSSGLFHLV